MALCLHNVVKPYTLLPLLCGFIDPIAKMLISPFTSKVKNEK